MEAVMLYSVSDQSISPYKQKRNHRSYNQAFASPRSSTENFMIKHQSMYGGGILFGPPPPTLNSTLPSSFVSGSNNRKQPPLLPLPISRPNSSLPIRNKNSKNLSTSPPPHKKMNTNNITPKKKKKKAKDNSPRKQDSLMIKAKSEIPVIRLGPEPSDLPKGVSKVLKPTSVILIEDVEDEEMKEEEICAPPPSSLPLPRFSMKPKVISCNVEVSGVDAGATDNLIRLLRLR